MSLRSRMMADQVPENWIDFVWCVCWCGSRERGDIKCFRLACNDGNSDACYNNNTRKN